MSGYDEQITRIASSAGGEGDDYEYIYLEIDIMGRRYRLAVEAHQEDDLVILEVDLFRDRGDELPQPLERSPFWRDNRVRRTASYVDDLDTVKP